MKVHIITQVEVDALIEKLELIKLRKREPFSQGKDEIFNDIHRAFHYEVVKFFQDSKW